MKSKKPCYSYTLLNKDVAKERLPRTVVFVGKSPYAFVVEKQRWMSDPVSGKHISASGARLFLVPVLMRWHLM